MRKRIIALLLAMLTPFAALAQEDTAEKLDRQLKKIFREYGTVGGTVAVARNGEIIYHYDYGYAAKAAREKVTPETYFRLASVTKMVTAIRLMQLAEEGMLSLDEPMGRYLGYPVRNPRHKTDVTLRMLMSHTSGLTGDLPSNWRLENLLGRKASWKGWKPGTQYSYSNYAAVMGSVIEAATGADMNSSLYDHVLSPLGIDGAYRVALLQHPEQAANAYTQEGELDRSRKSYLKMEWCGQADPEHHFSVAVGSLWMRADDLCRVGMMMCAGGTLDGVQLLKNETVAEMMASQTGRGGVTAESPYGLCVDRVPSLIEDRLVYGHQGQSGGIVCNVYWEPESEFVFVLMSNGCDRVLDGYREGRTRLVHLSRKAFDAAWKAYGETEE